jgi:S-adenosylmethionine hydrolase
MSVSQHPPCSFVRGCKVTFSYTSGTVYYTLVHGLGTLRPFVQVIETDENPAIIVPNSGLLYTITVVDKNTAQLHVEEATAATGRTFDVLFLAISGR